MELGKQAANQRLWELYVSLAHSREVGGIHPEALVGDEGGNIRLELP